MNKGLTRSLFSLLALLCVSLKLRGFESTPKAPSASIEEMPSVPADAPPDQKIVESSIAWFVQGPTPKRAQDTSSPENNSSACGLLTLRHIEAGGIGYDHGYTSLTGLAFPSTAEGHWIWPVVDMRVHEFNNNTQAINAGIGARFASSKLYRVFGGNLYYDYRNTHCGSYNQIGVGFEFLGERIDLRFNGYLPFGKKRRTISHCEFHYPGGFFMLRKKTETAIGGANVEAGAFITKVRSISFYAAAGPYYFNGDVCRHVFGGEFRFDIAYKKYFFIEGHISHDNVFKTKVQGIIGISLPLGCKSSKNDLTKRQFPDEMMSQPIQRHEIIVLKKNCSWKKNF